MFRFFKKLRDRRKSFLEGEMAKHNHNLEKVKVHSSLNKNIATSKTVFSDIDIIRYKMIHGPGDKPLKFFLVFCKEMVNTETINSNIVKTLMNFKPVTNAPVMDALLAEVLQVGETETTDNFQCIVERVTSGDTILFVEGCSRAAILVTKEFPTRSIEEPDNEKVLGGPREGFTESLMQNLTQVVRRLNTNDFKIKMLTLGKRTKTQVCVCYLDSLADKTIISDIFDRLNKIDIDGVLDSNYITELIGDNRYSPFRTVGYTERPDSVAGKLLEGRIAIFTNGSPMVLTAPYLFIENFQSSEDYYFSFFYTSFARMLRISAFILTITVPGLYISTVAFQPQMLPLQLLIRIAMERQTVPLPAAIEAVVMLLVFDILKETGIRMPSNIGQTLSIVGALVIGQAAVEASLVAAPMIIVVAATGITGLLVPKLNAPIIFWRLFILFMSSTFGFYGLTIGVSLMMIHINNLTSFGISQTSMRGNFRLQGIKDIFVRAPWNLMVERPDSLTSNKIRQTGDDENA